MSSARERPRIVLMVDDDPEDAYLARRAFVGADHADVFHHVGDGDALFAYLDNAAPFADRAVYPRPGLILLDVNIPPEGGFALLERLRAGDDEKASIPVIMLSTSTSDTDVRHAYRLGANAYLGKPSSAYALREVARRVDEFWFGTAEVPR